MRALSTVLIFARLTVKETQRRRILWVGLLMGLAFLLLFGVGFHYIILDFERFPTEGAEFDIPITFLTLAGLMATNFLVVILSVLMSVAIISSEIDNHTIDALITKPIYRWEVILGKWLGLAFMIFCGVLLLPGGVLAVVYLRAGITLNNVLPGLALMFLEGLVMMTVTVAGGTRLSTLANGALALMLYGLGFVGSWVEQVGALLRNETAVNIGIFSSLLSPTEILWRKASALFQPSVRLGDNFAGPFAIGSEPNSVMIGYAVGYLVVFLLFGLWSFQRRDI
jgi:ABC-type transport system involved in multi-copper enzyme maturation permease subunit